MKFARLMRAWADVSIGADNIDIALSVLQDEYPRAKVARLLLEKVDLDSAIELMEMFEAEEPSVSVGPAVRPLYAREPRTKKYGPAQNPDGYFSAEKLRAYNYGFTFAEGEPVSRLPEKEWLPLVGAVYRRDGFLCTYCGAHGGEYVLHCDHIVPVSRGGPNEMENLTTACDYCNCSKRDALPHEWRPLRAVAQ